MRNLIQLNVVRSYLLQMISMEWNGGNYWRPHDTVNKMKWKKRRFSININIKFIEIKITVAFFMIIAFMFLICFFFPSNKPKISLNIHKYIYKNEIDRWNIWILQRFFFKDPRRIFFYYILYCHKRNVKLHLLSASKWNSGKFKYLQTLVHNKYYM